MSNRVAMRVGFLVSCAWFAACASEPEQPQPDVADTAPIDVADTPDPAEVTLPDAEYPHDVAPDEPTDDPELDTHPPDADVESDDASDTDTVCAPQCEGRVCGPDACGGSCGTCQDGRICVSGACLVPLPPCGDGRVEGEETCDPGPNGPIEGCLATCQVAAGWTCTGEPSVCVQRDLEEDGTLCSRPIEIIPGKFFGRLSLAGQFNSYHPFYGDCLDEGFPTRSTGPDLTFSLAVREGSQLRVRMRSNVMPVTLALSTACGDDDPIDYVLNQACVAIAQTETLGTWAELT